MKIIELEQGSPDWLKWRDAGIGASDIATIMESNPYKTPYQLWEEKCGYVDNFSLTAPMIHGMRNEEQVRKTLSEENKITLKPICVEDEEENIFKASLDGYNKEEEILYEIKCPASYKTMEAAEKGIVHEYWKDQVQWQMMIAKPKKAYISLWHYDHDKIITIEIDEDLEKQEEMKQRALDFWNKVKSGEEPKRTARDYIEVEDPELEKLINKYMTIDEEEKKLKAEKNKLKDKIVEFGDDGSFMAYGAKIKRCHPRVTYDHKKMKEDGIDLKKYQKVTKSIGFYKIMLPSISIFP